MRARVMPRHAGDRPSAGIVHSLVAGARRESSTKHVAS